MDKKHKSSNDKREEKNLEKLVKASLFNRLKRNPIYNFFQRKDVKKYLIVITSAMVIGLMFGFITLKVLNHVGQPKDIGALTVNTNEAATETNEEEVSQEIKQLDAYVVQGGVFANKENLKEWKDRFQKEGVSAIEWKRDDLYYLFLGIGSSEQEIDKLKEKLLKKELDVYVKKWTTSNKEVHLPQDDLTWIDSFITLWESSITNMDNKDLFVKNWPDLIKSGENLSEKVTTFNNELQAGLNDNSLSSQEDKQYMLLLFWTLFEQHILD